MRLRQHAYTLVEVMLALTMMSIVATLAFPALSHLITQQQETVLQSQLLRVLQLARQEAMMHGVPVFVCGTSNQVACGDKWSDGVLVYTDAHTVIAVTEFNAHGGQLYWHAFPYYRRYLRMAPGMPVVVDNGVFVYCRANQRLPTFAVLLNKSGGAHVVYPEESGVIKDSRGRTMGCGPNVITR